MRAAKSGEIVIVKLKDRKLFVGKEEVFIPHKAAVIIKGVKGWWEMTLGQALHLRNANPNTKAPSFNVMTEYGIMVDCRQRGIRTIRIL